MTAVQAMAAVRSHWQAPSATRADAARRARNAPRLLPIPRPIRNTARIKEKVYTVPPSNSESRRVQTTSAPSADIPERAIARYTAQAPARAPALAARRGVGRRLVPGRGGRQGQGDHGHGHIEGERRRRWPWPCRKRAAGRSRPAGSRTRPRRCCRRRRNPATTPPQGRSRPSARSPAASRPSAAWAAASTPRPRPRAAGCPTGRGRRNARRPVRHTACRTTPRARWRRCPARAGRRPAAGAAGPRRGAARAGCPAHMPPMNVASSTPRETAVEPITSCRSWSQTTS